MASKKKWIVSCPRDCACRKSTTPQPSPKGGQPKWLIDWQDDHTVPGITSPTSPQAYGGQDGEDQDVVEDLPLGGSLSLGGSGPVSTMFRNPGGPGGQRITAEPYRPSSNEEMIRPTSTEATRPRSKNPSARPSRSFLPKSKTLGARDLAAINPLNDSAELDVPVNAWNRLVSDGAALASTAGSDTLGNELNTPARQAAERRKSHVGFGTIILLSKKHGIPPQEVRQCAEEFRQFDTNRDGVLSMTEFEVAARKRCDIAAHEPIPEILRSTMLKAAEARVDGNVGFEDFLLWVWQCIFMEEMSLTDSFEREQRNLARELGFDLPKLESLKEVFNSCDDDGSGFIEWPEFDQLVRCLLDAKEATDVSEALLRRYWKEATIGSTTGAIGFPDFVRWYAKNFDNH